MQPQGRGGTKLRATSKGRGLSGGKLPVQAGEGEKGVSCLAI